MGRGRLPGYRPGHAACTGVQGPPTEDHVLKAKLLYEHHGERTFALVFDAGEEVPSGLRDFANQANLLAAQLSAIGAFQDGILGYFDPDRKEYRKIPLREQVEVLSLLGNVAAHHGKPKVHAHVVVGKADGTAHGGHLVEAHVRPTLEVVVTEEPRHLWRQYDPASGLALLNPEAKRFGDFLRRSRRSPGRIGQISGNKRLEGPWRWLFVPLNRG